MSGSVPFAAEERGYRDDASRRLQRPLAIEAPVAFEINGVAYAVMMATPADLEDYALGFALSEGLVENAGGIADLAAHEVGAGWIIRLTLAAELAAPLLERVRIRVSEGSCGLCGLDSIEEVLRPLPSLATSLKVKPRAVERALDGLAAHQVEGARTGAMHAAAFCTANGDIVAAREDVGRHNALDKLVGALARASVDPRGGFLLVSARCSYELVEKTVRARCPMLVAISAPTSLAVERASQAGLTLVALARDDTMLVLNDTASVLVDAMQVGTGA